jgi:short-subunit dehydrogenase
MKKAIVVGATSGMGKELARLLAKNGYLVGVTGRRKALLVALKQEGPETFFIKTFDVTDTTLSILELNELVAELGGMDLLIISSGTGELNDNLDFEPEKRTIDTNVIGFTAIADWAFNYFRNQGFGHIAAISSIAGIRGMRHAPSYGSTKAYQINYLQALRQKAGKLNLPITITDIRPGFVNTDMAKGDDLFWVAPVDKAARQMFKALMHKKRVIYVTKRWGLVVWILRRIPNFIYNKM